MSVREDAFADWKDGMKYKEIAEKYGVSLSTVKSWASRHWKNQKKEKVATRNKKKLQPSDTELQLSEKDGVLKKRGAPAGNQNAKGNSGGGAPKRNQNNLKHGAYSKVYWDTLDETEKELLEDIPDDEEYYYRQQLALFTIRERRLMTRINEFQEQGKNSKGQFLKGVVKEKTLKYTGTVKSKSGTKDDKKANITDTTATETEAIINTIMALEDELTKVQKAKTKCIDSLVKLRIERQKVAGENKGNDVVDDWIAAVLGEDVDSDE